MAAEFLARTERGETAPALRVEPLPATVTNAHLRELLAPYNARRCNVAHATVEGAPQHLGWGVLLFFAESDMHRAYTELSGRFAFGAAQPLRLLPASRSDVEYVFGGRAPLRTSPGNEVAAIPASSATQPQQLRPPPLAEPVGVMRAFFGAGSAAPQPPPPQQQSTTTTTVQPTYQPPQLPTQPKLPQHLDLASVANPARQTFFLVAFCTACDAPRCTVPVEAALVVFSVNAGEIAHFHAVLAAGTLPAAVAPSAWWQSRRVHGLSPDSPLGERHYEEVWSRLIQLLHTHWHDQMQPPTLYGRGPELCNACLGWMAKMAGQTNPFPRVQPVEDLAEHLAAHVGKRRLATTEVSDCIGELCDHHPVPTQLCSIHTKLSQQQQQPSSPWRCALSDVRALCSKVVSMATAKPPQQQSST